MFFEYLDWWFQGKGKVFAIVLMTSMLLALVDQYHVFLTDFVYMQY